MNVSPLSSFVFANPIQLNQQNESKSSTDINKQKLTKQEKITKEEKENGNVKENFAQSI